MMFGECQYVFTGRVDPKDMLFFSILLLIHASLNISGLWQTHQRLMRNTNQASSNMPCVPKHFIWVFISTRQVVERLCNLKPIELRDDGGAEFELEMSLKDPSHKIFLFKVRNYSWLGSIHYILCMVR